MMKQTAIETPRSKRDPSLANTELYLGGTSIECGSDTGSYSKCHVYISAWDLVSEALLDELMRALRIATSEFIRARHDVARTHTAGAWLAVCEDIQALLPPLE